MYLFRVATYLLHRKLRIAHREIREMTPVTPWRGHLAGKAFATQFERTTEQPLTDALFATRFAPAGHPEIRIRAINIYWDFMRTGPSTWSGSSTKLLYHAVIEGDTGSNALDLHAATRRIAAQTPPIAHISP